MIDDIKATPYSLLAKKDNTGAGFLTVHAFGG